MNQGPLKGPHKTFPTTAAHCGPWHNTKPRQGNTTPRTFCSCRVWGISACFGLPRIPGICKENISPPLDFQPEGPGHLPIYRYGEDFHLTPPILAHTFSLRAITRSSSRAAQQLRACTTSTSSCQWQPESPDIRSTFDRYDKAMNIPIFLVESPVRVKYDAFSTVL